MIAFLQMPGGLKSVTKGPKLDLFCTRML